MPLSPTEDPVNQLPVLLGDPTGSPQTAVVINRAESNPVPVLSRPQRASKNFVTKDHCHGRVELSVGSGFLASVPPHGRVNKSNATTAGIALRFHLLSYLDLYLLGYHWQPHLHVPVV